MYEAAPDLSRLRQGDVLGPITAPRAYSPTQAMSIHSTLAPISPKDQSIVSTTQCHVVVLSQCCEFNAAKRPAFALARLTPAKHLAPALECALRPVSFLLTRLVPISKSYIRKGPETLDAAVVEEVFAANRVSTAAKNELRFLNSFLYRPDGLSLTEPHVADFADVFSASMRDLSALLPLKRLELTENWRSELRIKVGYFFSRPAM